MLFSQFTGLALVWMEPITALFTRPAPAPRAELKKPPPKLAPAGPSQAPSAIGTTALSKLDRKPASGKPVSGLIVSEPPCANASSCRF